MDKDKMDLALSIARSYYQYHELKKRLAAMEQELHEAKMAAAAYNKMIDIAERLYKIPVRKKSGPKQ